MKVNDTGHKLLERLEGFRAAPYLDVKGVPTIGYGNTYYADGRPVKMTDPPLTKEAAKELKELVLSRFEKVVTRHTTTRINQNQFNALVSFAYNVGAAAYKGSTLLKVVNKDPNNEEEIKKQFRRWHRSGNKSGVLASRREQEIKMYFS